MTTRRGFTLVEVLVALVLVLMVTGVTYQLLVKNQRVSRAQTSQVSMQDNVRTGALILGNELREVGYDEVTGAAAVATGQLPGLAVGTNPDLLAIGPDSIRYRAMRAIGFTCSVDGATGDIVVRRGPNYQQQRDPTLNDRMLLYVENNPKTSGDDVWVDAPITVAPVGQNCPDGNPGSRIRIGPPAGQVLGTLLLNTHVRVGGPVRVYEVMLLRSYQVGGQTWLGMRSISDPASVIQPVLGPLSGTTANDQGLSLVYRDANLFQTTVLNSVRSIDVTLKGVTDAPVYSKRAAYAQVDSLVLSTRVALRNALRP